MDDLAAQETPRRGRPPKNIERQVVQKVMAAAEEALKHKTPNEIKIRDIAAEAGVNATIVNYYFGGKDGLLVAILHEIMRDAPHGTYDNISAQCIEKQSIKPLVEAFGKFYYSRPGLIRMTMNEMMSATSEVRSAYHARYYDSTPEFVERIINSMMNLGIYNRHFDSRHLAVSILKMLLGPLGSRSTKYGLSDEMAGSDWIDFIAGVIDLAMKSPAPNQPH
jgi:AcrR family transcriptional regulator